MVVVMERQASEADIDAVAERVRSMGGEAFVSRGTVHTIIGLVGDTERFGAVDWKQLPGVDHVIHVGRGSDCQLVLEDDYVSTRHARVVDGPDGVYVEDLGSTNGITVNGHKVRSAVLGDGSRIEIGSTRMLVHDPTAR